MNALMSSFSKNQDKVEASIYVSELISMRIVHDRIVETRIRYKSSGLPLVGTTEVSILTLRMCLSEMLLSSLLHIWAGRYV